MAWISVDQKLIGGKLRSLYKGIGCSQNEAIGILITLWLWGIDNADMGGLIVSADRGDIEALLVPGLSPEVKAGNVVDKLIETGWVDEIDGQLFLHDWEDWRAYYNKYVDEKKKKAERMRRYRSKNATVGTTVDTTVDATIGKNESLTEQELKETPEEQTPQPKAKKAQEEKYGKDFEEFWSIYPRKADKGQAFKKYAARRKDGYSPEELKTAAENYRRQCERQRTETQYIKHAKTFLGDSLSFIDHLPKNPEPVRQESTAGGQGANPFRRNGG